MFGMGTGVTLAVIPPRNLFDLAGPETLWPAKPDSWVYFATDGSCLLQIPHKNFAMWKSLLDSPRS